MGCSQGKASKPSDAENGKGQVDRKSSNKKASADPFANSGGDSKIINVMGKYRMSTAKDDMMGEGTSSICRKGTVIETGEQVAIKVYKKTKESPKHEEVKLQKFRRQIAVLRDLQEPFVPHKDATLWADQLMQARPSRLFMTLIDWSKDNKGEPGANPSDNILYVVTELAQYSLKDYIALRRDNNKPLPKESVKNITKAIVLVVAGLHAKNYVHLDLKPENLMMFSGRLKLIDVDGCVKSGTNVSIQDSSISFSPCYCAPEWAKFLIEASDSKILINPSLDVWSVGMTICELVTLDAILKPMYANFLRNGNSHREASFLFMDWLSSVKKAPFPKHVERNLEKFDMQLYDLLANWLLVCDPQRRRTLASCLSAPHPYLMSASKPAPWNNVTPTQSDVEGNVLPNEDGPVERVIRGREEDQSNTAPVFQGTVWKLNSNGDPQDTAAYLQRDMWITANGSFCYFSKKDNKRLVLFDGSQLAGAKIEKFTGGCKPHAFKVQTHKEHDNEEGDKYDSTIFAVDSESDMKEWMLRLKHTARLDHMPRIRLGQGLKEEIDGFKLSVKNRRLKVEEGEEAAPIFKGILFKVKTDGDRMKEEDWFEREMWVAKNGCLVYHSKRDDKDLVYYTHDDLRRATISEIPEGDSLKPYSFTVQLPPSKDVEFAAGEFAAMSAEERRDWMNELRKLSR